MTASSSIARSSAAMAGGTIASRILGLVRQVLMVAAIGLGLTMDAFTVANTLPNIIYMVIAGGVLNSILVPQLVKAAKNPDGGREFTDRVLTLAGAAILGVTVLVTLAAGLLVRLVAGGLPSEALGLATFFAMICLPQIFFYGMYGLLGQVLNARGQFAAFGWAPFVANVVAIGGLVVFMLIFPRNVPLEQWTPAMVWWFAGSATMSIVVQALFLLIPLRRSGFRFRPRWGLRGVGLGQTTRVARRAFAALAVAQLGLVVATNVMAASVGQVPKGQFVPGPGVYANALLVFTLPHSFVALSVITALYPRISRAAHEGDTGSLRRDYARGLTIPTALTLPASVGLLVFALPISTVLFPSRPAVEVQAVALVIAAMALGVVPFGIDVLNQRFFYAHNDGRTAFLEQLVLTGSATAVNLSALAFRRPDLTVAIIGIGVVVSNVLSALFGMWFVRRRLGHLGARAIVRSLVRIGLAAAVAGAAAWVVSTGLGNVIEGRRAAVAILAVGGLVLAGVYLVLARVLRIREVREVLAPVTGRFGDRAAR